MNNNKSDQILLSDLFLSHHPKEQYRRCFSLNMLGKDLHLCSRCFGLYLSVFIFITLFYLNLFRIDGVLRYFVLFLFPIPAFIDWGFYRFKRAYGTNISRFTTGFVIGIVYAYLPITLIENPFDISPYLVILMYTSLAYWINKKTLLEA